ncbi:MAG: nicotinate phosphoribosyltransferase [Firmicutes bacterium]|jgi:nicotinate phosphoribosyltransferase|nr:nicotinate phosphoribosyltransferase [Bacillota bacterium]
MIGQEMTSLERVRNFQPEADRLFHSATHEEILWGATTDIYFVRSYELLHHMGLGGTPVVAEIFARRGGVLVGIQDVKRLLASKNSVKLWSLDEGEEFEPREVIARIEGPYDQFGLFETVILGFLASPSGWASAARECKRAAGDAPVYCFGARHLHPAVAPVMERAAIIGGFDGASCILAAKLAGREPVGTVPHAVILIMGDTVQVANVYDKVMPADAPRVILVDTFHDEAEEALRVAEAMGDRLAGVRLDTPGERGGVTTDLVFEVRNRLDQKGFNHVNIMVSGGLNPERIIDLKAAGASAFGVGSYVTAAPPIDMTMDIKVVNGVPVAKRGRIPGITDNPKLKRQI